MSFQEKQREWPYRKIEHWPPQTYRDHLSADSQTLAMFNEILEKENSTKGKKELQPWIPFCNSKCSFCYFPVSCKKQNLNTYLSALKRALGFYAEKKYVQSTVFNELYVGGGSPTVLSGEQIKDILQYCRKRFTFSADQVTKIAACTNSLHEEKIELLSSSEVDQLDIGVQTFDNSIREFLLLPDKAEEASSKIKLAKNWGIQVSIDLMYNLPGQTLKDWRRDIQQALQLEVASIDCYPLDLYPDTPLAKKIASREVPPPKDGETELEMYLEAYRIFRENGYYPTCHNRFSRVEEDFEDPVSEVIGTGTGFFMGHLGRFLYSDVGEVQDYIAKIRDEEFPIAGLKVLSKEEEMKRRMVDIYLRLPVDRKGFKAKFGKFPREAFPDILEKLKEKNLIEQVDGKIQLTEKGDPWRFNIAWEFFK